ncbi:MAG: tRNA (guanosine(37)-N1)-methyltransferase TrmD [Lachnospiraceae bacterium]|nr:tRNA (guanosine(37)-N1)-methyltransferase TrmD [Lachnospiraceae bacterium]
MEFYIMTLFPDLINAGLNESILGRAAKKGLIGFHAVDIRDYSKDKHRHVDDYPYGGGAGMVMKAKPVYDCYMDIAKDLPAGTRVIYTTPQGKRFDQETAAELAKEEALIILCGHYEGIDERVIERIVSDEISIGDYVLTGGELPAMVMVDAISRMLPGVLSNEESANDESFSDGLLEYPQYTRPEEFMGDRVPEVLLSGHHKNIASWRREKSLERTREKRPDLYDAYLKKQEK